MSVEQLTITSLEDLLTGSAATEPFKQAVRRLESGAPADLLELSAAGPPVKALRLIMKLLEAYPEIKFESIEIEAEAGCSDYTGRAVAQPGGVVFEFEWNCAWRADEQGWKDAFGDPDQIRAAQTFGYQCFRSLKMV